MSQIVTDQSQLPEASRFPSGLHATAKTRAECPGKVSTTFPVIGVPDLNCPLRASRGESRPVGAPRHRGDLPDVSPQSQQLSSRPRVPDPDRRIGAGRGQPGPVGTPANRQDRGKMPADREKVSMAERVKVIELPAPEVGLVVRRSPVRKQLIDTAESTSPTERRPRPGTAPVPCSGSCRGHLPSASGHRLQSPLPGRSR